MSAIQNLLAVCSEVEEFLADQADVVDSDYPDPPAPNKAMSLLAELERATRAVELERERTAEVS